MASQEEATEIGGQAATKATDMAHVVKEAAAAGAEDLKEAWEAAKEHVAPLSEPAAETEAEAANWTSNVVSWVGMHDSTVMICTAWHNKLSRPHCRRTATAAAGSRLSLGVMHG